jgi:hypothetical protein
MAKETITIVRDDLDGSEGASSYKFGWGDDQYEIDLTDKNAEELENFLNRYIEKAAKVTARLPRASAQGPSTMRKPGGNKEELQKIRQWAKDNGYDVSERGRVAQSIQDAYHAAN